MAELKNTDQQTELKDSKILGESAFVETRWSQVNLAGAKNLSGSHEALEKLCQTYWRPIYSFLRRKGKLPHEAEDFTQDFFLHLLRKDSIPRANPARGRFRSFLLGVLQHFLVDTHRKDSAQKRGAGKILKNVDFTEAEDPYLVAPDSSLTPDQVYDQQWAATLLQQALGGLRKEFEEAGQLVKFEAFRPFLSEEAADGAYDAVAAQFGMSRGAVSKSVQRMRLRYQKLVRQEVADTVVQAEDVEAELIDLF